MKPFVQHRASFLVLLFAFAISCFSAAEAPHRKPGTRVAAAATEGSAYFENAAALAKAAQKNPPPQDARAISLAHIAVERMLPSAQTVLHVQQIFYIANEHGAREYSTRSIQYYLDSQRLSILHARVYKADGRVVQALDAGERSVSDEKAKLYYDTQSHTVRFPSLQKGDVIDLEYRISPKSARNPYGDYFGSLIAFQNQVPQLLHRYVMIAPSSRDLNIVQERMPAMQVTMGNGKTIYSWEMRDIPPLDDEPRGPTLTEVAPYVNISTFRNWNQLGRWYADMIRPQFALNSKLKQALKEMTRNTYTDLDKIHAIDEFVLRNTRYEAMEFGIYRYKPYPVSQVYARRFGDCKDKASLMVALMRAEGIDAELALIRTQKLGQVSPGATNLSIFDHAIVYVPKYDLWLDGTAQYAGFKELPLDDQGAMALTVNLNGQAKLRRIPITSPMDNYTRRVVRAEVQPDGKIVFSGTALTRGEDAPGLRKEFVSPERQRDTLRANLAQVYPTVQIDTVHVKGANDLQHDVDVKFSGSLDQFAGAKTLSLVPSWLPHRYVDSLAPLQSRTQELELPAPWTTQEELHFTLPPGASFEKVPPDWSDETPFGSASVHYQREGGELVVATSVQFRKLRIAPIEYAAFRQFCIDIEKAFHEDIKVQLPQQDPAKQSEVASNSAHQ
jgi:hypothetical protein